MLTAQKIVSGLLFSGLAILAAFNSECGEPAKNKPRVVVLATGGTIAGVGDSTNNYAYSPSKIKVNQMLDSVSKLKDIANVEGEQVLQVASQNITNKMLIKLAKSCIKNLKRPEVSGIVITHGTDTMAETAWFLQLTLNSEKPIVLTGSMRPATALSADGANNLYNAVALAGNPKARNQGVMLMLNNTIHPAQDAWKSNTICVNTFKSPNDSPIGKAFYGAVELRKRKYLRGLFSGALKQKKLPEVKIIYAHQNMDGKLIKAAVDAKANGIVIAGTGNGNFSTVALPTVRNAIKSGVIVMRSARSASGMVLRNNEINDDKLGTVTSGNLNAQKARIFLMLALTKYKSPEKIQKTINDLCGTLHR